MAMIGDFRQNVAIVPDECLRMLAPDVLRQIRLLQLRARRSVQSLLGGQYHSAFKGSGVSFEEVREYQPGDDVRSIDWNVTARMGHPFLKRYIEERELTILLMVDASGSLRFGSGRQTKHETLVEVAALLACCAIANQDRIGLSVFTDQVHQHIRPAKGLRAVMRLLRELFVLKPTDQRTNLDQALIELGKLQRRRAIVFLLSDFLLPEWPKTLHRLARQHDLIAVRVQDPLERNWPDVGLIHLQDGETGEVQTIDSSSPAFRLQFQARQHEQADRLAQQLRGANADLIDVSTTGGAVEALMRFFRQREQRRRGGGR